jgi:hypothetical protein
VAPAAPAAAKSGSDATAPMGDTTKDSMASTENKKKKKKK